MSESWLPEAIGEGPLLHRVTGHRPAYSQAYQDVLTELWAQSEVDPVTLELCRLRIAQILRCEDARRERTPVAVEAGLDEDVVAELDRWPTSERFDARMRTCLGLVEQLLLDAQGVTDEQAATVIDTLGEGGYLVLVYGCGLFETNQRARLLLGAGAGPDQTPSIEG